MKLKLMILDKNINTGETNENDSWRSIEHKLDIEYLQLKKALTEADKLYIGKVAFDMLQILIRVLVLLSKERYDLTQINRRHNKKLVKGGWQESKFINIYIK